MRTPDPIWETEYKHDRRAHRHRCRCCNRIIEAGERVIMCGIRKGSVAIHLSCADKQYGTSEYVWRDALTIWGNQHLRKIGWKIPPHRMEIAA